MEESNGTQLDVDRLQRKRKKGWVAAVLNVFLPGAGYMYCGKWLLGIVAGPFLLFMALGTGMLGIVAAPSIWIILIIDGFLSVNRYNSELDEEVEDLMKACPFCAEAILKEAKICKYCGGAAEEKLTRTSSEEHSNAPMKTCSLCAEKIQLAARVCRYCGEWCGEKKEGGIS